MKMIHDDILNELNALQDTDYRDFQSRLIPSVDRSCFIGVRTPELRRLAKELAKRDDKEEFLCALPHKYFDEDQLHAFIISEIKDFESCTKHIDIFLPYVNNWATCDQMSPKCFRKHRTELLEHIREWIVSDRLYTVRFAVGMLMEHYLDEDFKDEYPLMVSRVNCEEYYISMMAAWYFATALAKQYSSVIGYIENNALDKLTHNRAIRKAIESRRITPEQKAFLRSFIRK